MRSNQFERNRYIRSSQVQLHSPASETLVYRDTTSCVARTPKSICVYVFGGRRVNWRVVVLVVLEGERELKACAKASHLRAPKHGDDALVHRFMAAADFIHPLNYSFDGTRSIASLQWLSPRGNGSKAGFRRAPICGPIAGGRFIGGCRIQAAVIV